MKIMHVTPYFHPAYAYGGIVRFVSDLAFQQSREGHDVFVFTTDVLDESSRCPQHQREETIDNIRIFRSLNVSNFLAYNCQFYTPLKLRQVLTLIPEVDLVHIHGCRHLLGSVASRKAWTAGVPYLMSPNGSFPAIERFFRVKRLYDLLLFDWEVKHAAAVTAVSKPEIEQFKDQNVSEQKIHLIPNCLDVTALSENTDLDHIPTAPADKKRKKILFLGKITPRKEVPTLVRAIILLDSDDLKLTIAGNFIGGQKEVAAALSRSGRSRIQCQGFRDLKEKITLIREADLVVYAGRDEIFGLVAFESLLLGTPVIVADDSGCGQLIAGNGFGRAVPPGDDQALAQAISEELERDHSRELSKAQEWIKNHLDVPVVSDQFRILYRQIMESRP
ncbi:glycosyltransferase family 4 protein [candidate division CSSED10-310 bacterium]|uniref:Glycosyltransferase family 4 protein n=1 Tax=candidate division CSSED10-310 bacterium TaxID=2855610 RepID=A0ABV6YWF9_UNCC1